MNRLVAGEIPRLDSGGWLTVLVFITGSSERVPLITGGKRDYPLIIVYTAMDFALSMKMGSFRNFDAADS